MIKYFHVVPTTLLIILSAEFRIFDVLYIEFGIGVFDRAHKKRRYFDFKSQYNLFKSCCT